MQCQHILIQSDSFSCAAFVSLENCKCSRYKSLKSSWV